eukprot:COSAG05_NODE_691_length_7896_cov_83.318549_4_plen_348_part_00
MAGLPVRRPRAYQYTTPKAWSCGSQLTLGQTRGIATGGAISNSLQPGICPCKVLDPHAAAPHERTNLRSLGRGSDCNGAMTMDCRRHVLLFVGTFTLGAEPDPDLEPEPHGLSLCTGGRYRSSATSACACQPGDWAANDTYGCQLCPAGSVTDALGNWGASSCSACATGKYSVVATEACAFCVAGGYEVEERERTEPSGARKCVQCPPGLFSRQGDSSPCAPCLGGNITDTLSGDGATDCFACPMGQASAAAPHSPCTMPPPPPPPLLLGVGVSVVVIVALLLLVIGVWAVRTLLRKRERDRVIAIRNQQELERKQRPERLRYAPVITRLTQRALPIILSLTTTVPL